MASEANQGASRHRRVPVFRNLFAIGVAVLALNAIVVTVLVVRQAEAEVNVAAVRELEADSVMVRRTIGSESRDEVERLLPQLADELGVRFTVIGVDGVLIADTAPNRTGTEDDRSSEIVTALAGRTGTDVRGTDTAGRKSLFVAVPPTASVPFVVRAAVDYGRIDAHAKAVRDATILVTTLAGSGALLVLLVFARRVDTRLNQAIDERTRVEAERQRTEQMFRDFVETTTEWVWAVDESFTLTYANPAVRDILGYTPEDIVGRPMHALVHPDDAEQVQRELLSLKAMRQGWHDLVLRWRHKNGTFRYLESAAVPIVAPNGSLVGYRGADRDVTDRREAERMKSDFVSFVSHQLRTPLAGMKWMLELAGGVSNVPDDAREYIAESQASADRLARLVNDLLDIARLESGRFVLSQDNVALDQLTREVVKEFVNVARDKGLTLTEDLKGPAMIRADPQMMRQVVTNLISNAVKYTPPGGAVRIGLDVQNGLARWAVRDSGMGIPKAAQSRLFEKFFRADNAISLETEGSGLGLHLVRLILEHSGGRIWCESEEGRGATFTFTLPVREMTT